MYCAIRRKNVYINVTDVINVDTSTIIIMNFAIGNTSGYLPKYIT